MDTPIDHERHHDHDRILDQVERQVGKEGVTPIKILDRGVSQLAKSQQTLVGHAIKIDIERQHHENIEDRGRDQLQKGRHRETDCHSFHIPFFLVDPNGGNDKYRRINKIGKFTDVHRLRSHHHLDERFDEKNAKRGPRPISKARDEGWDLIEMEFEKRRQKEQIKMKDRHDIKNRGDGAKNTNPSDEVHPIKMTAALGAAKELDHVDDPDNQGD